MRPRVHPPALLVAVSGAAALAGCAHSSASQPREAHPSSRVVSIGRPVAPRPAPPWSGGTFEMKAPAGGNPHSPGFRLVVLRAPGADARDLCVATGAIGVRAGEANRACDVRAPGGAAVFVEHPGIPDRLGPAPTVVAGIAPPDVVRVAISGPGGRWNLPLSRHRAFLALYAHGVRGRVRVIADRRSGGSSTRSFSLARPTSVIPGHPHRRAGAVFGDEVGEAILRRSYSSLLRHFGPPAAVRREHGERCAYYEVVGDAATGWRFCFAGGGRMVSAGGNQPLPP